tara:strand:- start:1354 stop:1641 length:288 start_codon:yes stop_codon:yes gene_type:complete
VTGRAKHSRANKTSNIGFVKINKALAALHFVTEVQLTDYFFLPFQFQRQCDKINVTDGQIWIALQVSSDVSESPFRFLKISERPTSSNLLHKEGV